MMQIEKSRGGFFCASLLKSYFDIIILCIFVICAFVEIQHHEIWRDEAQAWLLSRDSFNAMDLLRNARYESHPVLWHLMLMPLAHLGFTVVSMQLLHLSIAAIFVYILLKKSPFTNKEKTLIAFSYYIAYEYTIIARNYGISVTILFMLAAFYNKKPKSMLPWGVLIFFLAQTNALSMLIAVSYTATYIFICLYSLYSGKACWTTTAKHKSLAVLISIVGIALSVLQIIPPPDSSFAKPFVIPSFGTMNTCLAEAFVPLPLHWPNFWNNPLWKGTFFSNFVKFGVFFLNVLFVIRIRRYHNLLLSYLLSMLSLLVFFGAVHLGYTRHHGLLFIVFIVHEWMYRSTTQIDFSETSFHLAVLFSKCYNFLFPVILILQFVGTLNAYFIDFNYPFSCSKLAAEYLKDKNIKADTVVPYPEYMATPIIAYLNIPSVYYSCAGVSGSFNIWNKASQNNNSQQHALSSALNLSDLKGVDVYFLTNRQIDQRLAGPRLHLLALYSTTLTNESYFIYCISHVSKHDPAKYPFGHQLEGGDFVP